MIEVVREFLVKAGEEARFELAFGPGGAVGRLLERAPGFRGTTLLRDADQPRRYLAIELWDSAERREQALASGGAEAAALEASFADWSEERRELGRFRLLAQANVRPRGRRGAR